MHTCSLCIYLLILDFSLSEGKKAQRGKETLLDPAKGNVGRTGKESTDPCSDNKRDERPCRQ